MDPVQIIFFDIDGTLVDPATGKIPPKTFEALELLRKKGILLCIATGRPTASLPDFGGFPFDAMGTFNGSLCYCGDAIIHSHPIDPEDVRIVLGNAAQINQPVTLALRNRLAASGWDADLDGYYRLAGLELTVAEDFDAACREPVYQIMLGCREEDHPSILRDTRNVEITFSWDRAADVIPAGSGKAQAIEKILDHYHLDSAQAMAFGDGYNDLVMLQAVGKGIAMGNADERLKVIADDVCGSVGEDGIYRYCVDHGLI